MDRIDRLIERAMSPRPETSETAIQELAAIGMPAVSAVIDAIRTHSNGSTWNLSKVLLRIRDREIVPFLIELIDDDNGDLVHTAFKAIEVLKDSRASRPLEEYLQDPTNLPADRALAAEALGEIGNSGTVDVLLEVGHDILEESDVAPAVRTTSLTEEEWIDEDLLFLFLSIAVALAKLGNHKMATEVAALVRYRREDVYGSDEVIRARAAQAFQYTVCDGAFSIVREALSDDYDEVRQNALDAVFYLGLKEGVGALIDRVGDENTTISHNALIRIRDLTGAQFEEDSSVEDVKAWWTQHRDVYETGVCYRSGHPIWLPDIIDLLTEPHRRELIVRELRIITGEDFGYNPYVSAEEQDSVVRNARMWWSENSDRFERGKLYKYGREQNIDMLY